MTDFQKQEKDSHGILEGLRVIELGHYIAAPIVGMLLAEQGAEVLHVINPKEQTADPLFDAILERTKQRIELDFNQPENVAYIKDLLANADIVVENYAPNTFHKFGIDFDQIRKEINPRLISCSIPAFPDGDSRANIPGYEAIAGMAGLIYERVMKRPSLHTFPVGSILAALYSCSAIMGALIARVRDGLGQHIEVSLYESNVFAQMLQILVLNGAPRSFMPLKMVGTPFMGVWECADKRYIYVHITMPLHNAQILDELEKNGFSKEIGELRTVMSESTRKDPSQISSVQEANQIKQIMGNLYRQKTADEWEQLLGNQFCVIKIRNLEEWIQECKEKQMQDAVELQDDIFGSFYTIGKTIHCPTAKSYIEPRKMNLPNPLALLNRWKKQTDMIYSALPDAFKQIKYTNNNRSAPLEGIKVFDMARVIAGPFVARILREMGAEVISVQSPSNLDWGLAFHVIFNAGKKSVVIDFNTDEGKQQLRQLLERFAPDIFLQNYRSLEFSKEINLDYDSIKAIFPEIVYSYVNAYGIEGGWQGRPAFEQVIQAVTGLQLEYVGSKKPRIFPVPILDMGAGLLGSFGTLLGLYRKITTGTGGFYHVHMTSMAMLLQTQGFSRFQNEKLLTLPAEKLTLLRYNPELEIYSVILPTLDRYICLSGPKRYIGEWLNIARLAKGNPLDVEKLLKSGAPLIQLLSWRHWQRSLKRRKYFNKIGLIKRHKIAQILKYTTKHDKRAMKLVCKKNYPGMGELTFVHTPIHFSDTPIIDIDAAPRRGQNSLEILTKYTDNPPLVDPVLSYPQDKPFLSWFWNFVVWGYYAIKSGNV